MIAHDSDGITAQRDPATRLMFKRRDASGTVYLHKIDLTKTTTNRDHAWIGSERQAFNVRAKFPHTRSMPLVRVSHKTR